MYTFKTNNDAISTVTCKYLFMPHRYQFSNKIQSRSELIETYAIIYIVIAY